MCYQLLKCVKIQYYKKFVLTLVTIKNKIAKTVINPWHILNIPCC